MVSPVAAVSIEARDWAWSRPSDGLNAAGRLVLLALAERANSDGAAWPALPTLIAMTGLNRATVQRSISALERAGLLSRVTGSGRRSTRYQLAIEGPQDAAARAVDNEMSPERRGRTLRPQGPHPAPVEAASCGPNRQNRQGTSPLPPSDSTNDDPTRLEQRAASIIERAAHFEAQHRRDVRNPTGFARHRADQLRNEPEQWAHATHLARWPQAVPLEALARQFITPAADHLAPWRHLDPDGHPIHCRCEGTGQLYDEQTRTSRPCTGNDQRRTA